MKKRIVVLVSGRGTNLQAIIDHCKSSPLATVVEVVSSTESVFALMRAKSENIRHTILPLKERNSFLLKRLEELSPDLVVLAGYMKILPSDIINKFRNRIINIHPSLLPSFKGLEAPKQALEFGAKVTGCTVHFVDEGVDSGPIILQQSVTIDEDDTEGSLAQKILPFEHKLLVEAVDLFCRGSIRIDGRRVYIVNRDLHESKPEPTRSHQIHLS